MIALLGAPSLSTALGWGNARTSAVLGRPLDFAVPVRVEPGEEFAPECVDAEVHFGESRVSGSQVQVRVEPLPGAGGERLVRVQTTASIEEPIVSVQVATGCRARLVRKFVAFADPPLVATDGTALPSVAAVPSTSDVPVQEGRRARAEAPRTGPPAQAPGEGASKTKERRATSRAAAREPADASRGRASVVPSSSPRSEAKAGPGAPRTPGPQPAPRLKLDPLEPESVASLRLTPELSGASSTSEPAQRQAAAALWAGVSATPEQAASASARMQALEQSLLQLRAESARTRESLESLQAQLRAAREDRYANPLVYALGALSAALAAALLWVLARRGAPPARQWWAPSALAESRRRALEEEVSALQSERRESADWAKADVRRPSGPTTFSGEAEPAPRAGPAAEAPSPVASAAAAPAPRAVLPLREDHAHNGKVSVEELIDLEQRAEFFVALGQEESAIALLQSHVQHHPDGSPLPYLKLMEIHQQRGDRDAYESVRGEFNQRFNAYAPAWEESLADGRSLEDYPAVISRLQGLWETPARALEVLQASLLRRDTSAQTFDLPAYRELLLLYSIARERVEHADEGGVDILLPFDEPAPRFGQTMLEPLTAAAPAPATSAPASAPASATGAAPPTPQFEIDLPLDDFPPVPAPSPAPVDHPSGRVIDFEPVDLDVNIPARGGDGRTGRG